MSTQNTMSKLFSEAHRKKLREAKVGFVPWNKGRKHTEATKKKMREAHKDIHWGKDNSRYGKKLSKDTRRKMSKAQEGKHVGKLNVQWKGGVSVENRWVRYGVENRLWRESVFARDNWTCQKCNNRGGDLEAHHIKNFADYKELRTSIENGITFCKKCHKKFHKKYGNRKTTKKQTVSFCESDTNSNENRVQS